MMIAMTTCVMATTKAAAKLPKKAEHVHPLFWWAGMEETSLQVMIHAQGIGDCEVKLEGAKGVKISKTERVENKNYLFVYLDLKGAEAQTFNFILTQGKQKMAVPYEIRKRDGIKPMIFDASDVIYLLMPDRFINGDKANDNVEGMKEQGCDPTIADARHGGDLQGMEDGLDYLSELGITAIWPTPIQTNDEAHCSYHGYAISNYYQIDPRFGTNEKMAELTKKCHEKGIKMIMDLVFNHCGASNFLFSDMPQEDWFNHGRKYIQTSYKTGAATDIHAANDEVALTQDGWFVESMPDFNQKNKMVLDYLVQTAIWWTEYAHIDGIRQDTYPYCDMESMAEWCKRMDKEYPGYNIVGETWMGNNVGVSCWQKGSKLIAPRNSELPTVMDFPLMNAIHTAVDEETNEWDQGLARIYEYISQDVIYEDPMHLLVFLTNHDTDRFAKTVEEAKNINRYKQALTLILTLRGIPQLYNGDEIGMDSNKSKGDGELRKDFPKAALTKAGRNELQEEYFEFSKKLLNWRKTSEAVCKGSLVHYAIKNSCYVYSRHHGNETATIIMNGSDKEQTIDLGRYSEVLPKASAKDIVSGETVETRGNMNLKPRQIVVLSFK